MPFFEKWSNAWCKWLIRKASIEAGVRDVFGTSVLPSIPCTFGRIFEVGIYVFSCKLLDVRATPSGVLNGNQCVHRTSETVVQVIGTGRRSLDWCITKGFFGSCLIETSFADNTFSRQFLFTRRKTSGYQFGKKTSCQALFVTTKTLLFFGSKAEDFCIFTPLASILNFLCLKSLRARFSALILTPMTLRIYGKRQEGTLW